MGNASTASIELHHIGAPNLDGDQRLELLVCQGAGDSRTWTAMTARVEWHRDSWGDWQLTVWAERVVSVEGLHTEAVYLMQAPSEELTRLVENDRELASRVRRYEMEAA